MKFGMLMAGVLASVFGATSFADVKKGKVLVVMSAADEVNLTGGHKLKTGYFLRELTEPLAAVVKAGYDVTFASPGGKVPVVDEFSKKKIWYVLPDPLPTRARRRLAAALAVEASRGDTLGDLKRPIRLEDLTEKELSQYAGVFVPGGHSPVANLVNNPALGAVLRHFHVHGKPTALICHAPIALLSAREPGKEWIYRGYEISVATTAEEKLMERIGPMRPHQLSFDNAGKEEHYVDTPLAEAGAVLLTNPVPSFPKVTQDRELITAQNPASAEAFGELFVNALSAQTGAAFSELRKLKANELAALFAASGVDERAFVMPVGDAVGLPLLVSNRKVNSFANLFWAGKVFSTDATVVNKILGFNSGRDFKMIRAKVRVGQLTKELQVPAGTELSGKFPGSSAVVDEKSSVLLDYSGSGWPVVDEIVDEMRPIWSDKYPGLYLGRATTRDKKFWCYFALSFPTPRP